MQVVHLDKNHPILLQRLEEAGFHNIEAYDVSRDALLQQPDLLEGLVIRSRFPIDRDFIDAAPALQFIARVGAGLENIDTVYAAKKGISLFSAPEGNENAVGEHALGMLLSLMNKLQQAHEQVRAGSWQREANRGVELAGKTVGIIGYGHMGKSFSRKLRGFDVKVICQDILPGKGDRFAQQVSLEFLQQHADVVSLHTPLTPSTMSMVNKDFIEAFEKPFWFINTARGKSVVTADLVEGLQSGKVLGAGLDVLEYEKSSFEDLFLDAQSGPLQKLLQMPNVVLSPHVAGWTVESHFKLADTIARKIIMAFGNPQEL